MLREGSHDPQADQGWQIVAPPEPCAPWCPAKEVIRAAREDGVSQCGNSAAEFSLGFQMHGQAEDMRHTKSQY